MTEDQAQPKKRKKRVSHDDDDGDHGDEGGGGHESDEHLWLYSFNDMLFNLLLFFIVMFSISSVNKSKFHAVADALHIPGKQGKDEEVINFKRNNVATSESYSADTCLYLKFKPEDSSNFGKPQHQIGDINGECKFQTAIS